MIRGTLGRTPTRQLARLVGLAAILLAAPRALLAQPRPHAPPPAPAVPAQVGVVAAVAGNVEITPPTTVGRIAQSGEPVHLGDRVETDATGRLQILLLDETVFTIGPNSAIVIDEFVYDPQTDAGKISAEVVRGVFRFVTGKIARKDPAQMEVALPAGLIGIRGTMAIGQVEGQHSTVALLGPGARNNTGEPPGQILVSNVVGQQVESVAITRPGFGTEIAGPDAVPLPPFQIPETQMAAMTGALAAPSGQGADSGDQAGAGGAASGSALAGQDQAIAMVASFSAEGASALSALFATVSSEAAQQIADGVNKFFTGNATLDQLRTIESGQFHYAFADSAFIQTQKDGAAVSIGGLLTAKVNIDFGARTVGGGESFVRVDTLNAGGGGDIFEQTPFIQNSFASGSGSAVFGSIVSNTTAALSVKREGSAIGQTADLAVVFDNGSDVGAGAVFGRERTSGLAPP
jgi:hypothetical protein